MQGWEKEHLRVPIASSGLRDPPIKYSTRDRNLSLYQGMPEQVRLGLLIFNLNKIRALFAHPLRQPLIQHAFLTHIMI